jgi:recombination protein RecA
MALTSDRRVEQGNGSGGGERGKAVEAAILAIEKQFGRGSIMRLGSAERQQVDFIPSGSIALDLALGVGGIPRGRITEIYGPEASGKTTVCQHIIAEAQRRGGVAAFIDVEHALDPGYARACGVNVDELLVSQPDTGEQALEITETLIRSGGIDVVVVDSVAALVPRAEIEGEMGDSFVGIQARLMSQALRKLTGAVSRSNTSLVFTNQLREKIGVMFGNPEVTPGGRALKFYATVRLEIRRVETIKTGTESVGNRVRVKVVKNKVAPPFRVAEFDVMYGEGISREGGLLDVGVAMNVVTKTGAWFTYGETRLGQGREAAKVFLRENPSIATEIEGRIRTGMSTAEIPVEGIEEAE